MIETLKVWSELVITGSIPSTAFCFICEILAGSLAAKMFPFSDL